MATNNFFKVFFSTVLVIAVSVVGFAQTNADPWKQDQLMPPAELAKIINEGKEQPHIFSIGQDALVKGAIDIGPASESSNLEKLRQQVSKLPKDANIVIYCGCCPFGPCPNIRPAFNLLKEMKFTNYKLLSLQKNIKADWLTKGYPVKK